MFQSHYFQNFKHFFEIYSIVITIVVFSITNLFFQRPTYSIKFTVAEYQRNKQEFKQILSFKQFTQDFQMSNVTAKCLTNSWLYRKNSPFKGYPFDNRNYYETRKPNNKIKNRISTRHFVIPVLSRYYIQTHTKK